MILLFLHHPPHWKFIAKFYSSPSKIYPKSIHLFMFIAMTLTQTTIISHLAHCHNIKLYLCLLCFSPTIQSPHSIKVTLQGISLLQTLWYLLQSVMFIILNSLPWPCRAYSSNLISYQVQPVSQWPHWEKHCLFFPFFLNTPCFFCPHGLCIHFLTLPHFLVPLPRDVLP